MKAEPVASIIGVPLERPPRPLWHRRALRGLPWRPFRHTPTAGLQQRIHHLPSILDRPVELATASFPRPDDLAQRHRLTGQFLADGPADETALVEDPDLRDVTRVVPQQDLLPD